VRQFYRVIFQYVFDTEEQVSQEWLDIRCYNDPNYNQSDVLDNDPPIHLISFIVDVKEIKNELHVTVHLLMNINRKEHILTCLNMMKTID
jgi:hypothetical protein